MNLYENAATQAIASFFHHEPLWKNELLFGFLLEPFGIPLVDVKDVVTQDHLQGTIPDFTIKTQKGNIHFEVKIKDVPLTASEMEANSRDAFLVRKNYSHRSEIPVEKDKILFWEDLFARIDEKGAANEFTRLALVREYMKDAEHTILLTPHEVAMLYSPKTISAVYTMSDKILTLCKQCVDSLDPNFFAPGTQQQDGTGIGQYFSETTGQQRLFFVGISPTVRDEYSFSVAFRLDENCKGQCENWYIDGDYAFFPLDRELLAKKLSEAELQEQFNKNVENVIEQIRSSAPKGPGRAGESL